MKTGVIVLIPFPFAELTNIKVRPALLVTTTKDKYKDLILCAISSVVPSTLNEFEVLLQPNSINNLRVPSIIKIDRILTLKNENVIKILGNISRSENVQFIELFKKLVS